MEEIVKFFESKNIKTAVVTASTVEVAEDFMKKAGIRECISKIISARGVKRGKPFPYVYEYAASNMGFKPSECIAFEDSQNGIMSAKSAGLYTVFIPDLTPLDNTVRDYTDECYDSLYEFVKHYTF